MGWKNKPIFSKYVPPEPMKGKIVYEQITKPAYKSRYTYLMAFAQLNLEDDSIEWKYVHLVSTEPMTKKNLKTMLRENVLEDEENMDTYADLIPILGSIILVKAWQEGI